MKTKRWLCGLLLLAATGCSSMNHTERGAVGGGLIGAAAGTVIGAATGNPGAGAAIGGAGGALLGGAIGNDADRTERRHAQAAAEFAARNPPLSLNDVVQMSQQRIGDDVIIAQMDSTSSCYNLTAADIQHLHLQGVSDRVIRSMQARRYPAPMVVPARPVSHVYVVEPMPPPPPIGFGFSFSSGPRCGRRCW